MREKLSSFHKQQIDLETNCQLMMLLTDITKIEYKNPVTMVSNACGIYVDFKKALEFDMHSWSYDTG